MWGRMQPRTLLFLTSTGAAVGASADAVEAVAAAAAINARVDAGRFGPGWATRTHRRLATTSSEATCDGILSGTTCCSAACGECGGFDCSLRGNGAEDCCAEDVLERGILCSATGGAPPCILEGDPEPLSPEPDATLAADTSGATPSPEPPYSGLDPTPAPQTYGPTPSWETTATRSPSTPFQETVSPVSPETRSPEMPDTSSQSTSETPSPEATAIPTPLMPETPSPLMPETPHPVAPEAPTPDTVPPTSPETNAPVTPVASTPAPTPVDPPTPPPVLPTSAPVVAPTAPPTPSPATHAPEDRTPETVAPASPAPNASGSPGRTAMPTLAPLGRAAPPSPAPSPVPGAALVAAPTAAPSSPPGVTATRSPVQGTRSPVPAVDVALGTGFLSGSFSADGVSDDVLAWLGEEGVCKQVICELDPCTGGTKSVLVGDEAATQASTRMLLLRPQPPDKGVSGQRRRDPYQTIGHGEQLRRRAVHGEDGGFLRGQGPAPQSEDKTEVPGRMRLRRRESGLRRRRLGDIVDVDFLVPLEGGIEGGDGEVMTESQQAAAFVNNMADMGVLAGIAADIGVNSDDLDFADLVFFQGSAEFPIRKEFGAGYVELSSIRVSGDGDGDPGLVGTCVLGLFLVAAMALAVAFFWRYRLNTLNKQPTFKRQRLHPAGVSSTACEIKLATFNEERGGDVDVDGPQDELDYAYEYGNASLARRGGGGGGDGGRLSSRHEGSGGVARNDGRRGKNMAPERTASPNSFDMQHHQHHQHQRARGGEVDDSSTSSMDSGEMPQQQDCEGADDSANPDSRDGRKTTLRQAAIAARARMKAPLKFRPRRSRRGVASQKDDGHGQNGHDLAQHYRNISGGTSSLASYSWVDHAHFNPIFDASTTQPQRQDFEDDASSESGSPHERPQAEMNAIRARSHSRVFSEMSLHPIAETGPASNRYLDRTNSRSPPPEYEDEQRQPSSGSEDKSESPQAELEVGIATRAPPPPSYDLLCSEINHPFAVDGEYPRGWGKMDSDSGSPQRTPDVLPATGVPRSHSRPFDSDCGSPLRTPDALPATGVPRSHSRPFDSDCESPQRTPDALPATGAPRSHNRGFSEVSLSSVVETDPAVNRHSERSGGQSRLREHEDKQRHASRGPVRVAQSAAFSEGLSWAMESRMMSFSPSRRDYRKRESLSSLGSSFSETISDDEHLPPEERGHRRGGRRRGDRRRESSAQISPEARQGELWDSDDSDHERTS